MVCDRPTPVTFFGAVKLCFLLLFAPKVFLTLQEQDNELLKAQSQGQREPGAFVVRRAFFKSALLVVASGIVGYLGGIATGAVHICASPKHVMWLQIVGACVLLWGTLFVRGWDIQTYGGLTLTERVNQWIYRALYCVGTAVVVFSVAWPSCTQG
jgi:hypothetical protein